MKFSRLLSLTLIRVALNTAHRMVYPFLAVFARGLGVDLTTISALMANRAIVGAVAPFVFPFLEPRGRKFGMMLGLSLFILAMGMVAFYPSLLSLAIALPLSLACKAFFDPSLAAYVSDHTPYKDRGRAIAVLEFAWSLAFILGIPAAGWLIAQSGWTTPFSILAILGIAAFLYILSSLDDTAKPEHHEDGLFGNIKAIFISPATLAALSVGVFVSAANELVSLMFGVWLEDSFKLQIAALGAASAVIGFSELSGEGLVFLLVDKLGKVRASGIGIVANCIAGGALPFIGKTEFGALAGLFFFYITFEFTIVSIIPLMTEVMPSARATMLAFTGASHSVGRAIGAFAAPALYALGFPYIALFSIVFNLLGLAAIGYVSRSAHNH